MQRKDPASSASPTDARRSLASVAAVLEQPRMAELATCFSRPLVTDAVREALEALRAELADGAAAPPMAAIVARAEERLLAREADRLRPVVNATGIILHTGLGRAVLPPRAVRALAGLDRCCNLQIDMETGERGKRDAACARLLCRLTGAEAAMLVNNNAAATMLSLAALCPGREVIVSRGQLIEIGGSYRLPDCIAASGARLVEVGTTNKTHLRDYAEAIGDATAAVMRVNPSNYRVVGFTREVTTAELATLKKDRPDLLLIDDLGCGALVDLRRFGLPHEPTVQESIAAGADLCCFSGDKLIGGPQAGIIVGRKELIARIRKHPLTRMLRVGKLTGMALEQTLRLFLEPETLIENHPTLRMLTMSAEAVKRRALRLKRKIERAGNGSVKIRVIEGASATGGGSLPATPIPTWLLAVSDATNLSAERLLKRLRDHEPPIVARIEKDAVVLDLRTVFVEEEHAIIDAFAN